jgi:hypothetical protein
LRYPHTGYAEVLVVSHSRFRRLRLLLIGALCVSMIAPTLADTPPRLLDDNRGDHALAVAESAAFNAAVILLGFPVNPFVSPYLPIVLEGRVLSHPKIHNIYLDDDWDAHNPDAPTVAQLDGFTRALAAGPYLDAAIQYGVHRAEFTGSHGRSLLCAPVQPELGHAELAELNAWITCEVSFSPPVPGLIPPLTGVPQTNDDTLYVVYLPRSMDIVDADCGQMSAMHFFGAAPNFKIDSVLGVPVPRFYSQTFAYALVPSKCAGGGSAQAIRDNLTEAASHEIIEAATDPIVGTGWINNSVVTDVHGGLISELIDAFANIPLDLRAGEVADICEENAQAPPGPPAFPHPTEAVPLVVDDPSLDNRIMVAPYWSAADAEAHANDPVPFNACVPILPKSTVKFGTPTFAGGGGQFITSGTPVTIDATDGGTNTGIATVSYRFFPVGATPPDFTTQPLPIQFAVTGSDGPYLIETFATGNNGLIEVTHATGAVLDNTAPISTIVTPAATQYVHSSTLTLAYSTTDGAGSGVATETATLDGATTVGGHGLASGQAINLLTELALGPHAFNVAGVDHVTNRGVAAVSFTIVVTAESIKDDVNEFLAAGLIKNKGLANSLLAKLSSAADARTRGQCGTASNKYQAFVNELQAQGAKGVDAQAAAIMIGDAQFLIANCP